MPRFDMRKFSVLSGVAIVSLFLLISGQLPSFFIVYRNSELQLSQPGQARVSNHFTTSSLQTEPTQTVKPVFDTGPARSFSTDAHESDSRVMGERRRFYPVGSGAYLFIEMGAYRGGPRFFSIVGLGSKPLHDFADASFKCEWISASGNHSASGHTWKNIPEHWGFSRVYTTVVVSCVFDEDVGTASEGGDLILHASPGSSFEKNTERMIALREQPGDYNATSFDPPYRYEYAYCGSPLYGDISPQRVREWIVYHANFFGPRSHFFFYDAGGIHPGVLTVLQPWIDAGRVTIQNVEDQEQFDGHYHNQFLIVNDCLHSTRYLANWTFFFDIDEFLYVPEKSSIQSILAENSGFTQIHMEQVPMSNQLCLNDSSENLSELWGFEKLVFKYVNKFGTRYDRKYAIQPRNAFAGGVHFSENLIGNSSIVNSEKLRYYHYHGALSFRGEVCRGFVDRTNSTGIVSFGGEPVVADYSMRPLGAPSRSFELEHFGKQPFLI